MKVHWVYFLQSEKTFSDEPGIIYSSELCPPLKKEGHIALHLGRYVMSVMSVALNLVQLKLKKALPQKLQTFR